MVMANRSRSASLSDVRAARESSVQSSEGMDSKVRVTKGFCYAVFAYDVALSIDLKDAARRISASKERGTISQSSRTPHYLEFRPAPLRVVLDTKPLTIAEYTSSGSLEALLYDFGALSVIYKIPLEGPISRLAALSEELYENQKLLAESRHRVEQLLALIGPAVERPSVASYVEDYFIFHLESYPSSSGRPIWTRHHQEWAQILRSERSPLSEQEVKDAISSRLSFRPHDAVIVDWNAAILFGQDMEDVMAVLNFANVELLEMRILDHQLDDSLDQAYEALSKKLWRRLRLPGAIESDSTRVAQLQVDSAILFERVTNTLKLLGDQYLARVYRLVSQRFHLAAWDASIIRKLQALDSIYGKMADQTATRRMEVLEWIIIILIAISIIIPFLPGP